MKTTQKRTFDQEKLRLVKTNDYWWNILIGGLLTSIFLISFGGFVFKKLNVTFLFFPYSLFCIFIIAYYQWRDDNLKEIQTGLSKSHNFILVAASLEKINWHYESSTTNINLTLNKYILKFLNPTIILENDKILINFQYQSTNKSGRLPFFFGVSTYLEWKFKKTLQDIMLGPHKLNINKNINSK